MDIAVRHLALATALAVIVSPLGSTPSIVPDPAFPSSIAQAYRISKHLPQALFFAAAPSRTFADGGARHRSFVIT